MRAGSMGAVPGGGDHLRDPVVAAALRAVVRCPDPERVLLFGSRSRGSTRPDSDLDLIVVADVGLRRRSLSRELRGEPRRRPRDAGRRAAGDTEPAQAKPTSFLGSVLGSAAEIYVRSHTQGESAAGR
jgi:predicted nucleotidyltransferase